MALVLGLVTVKLIAVVAGPAALGAFSLVRSLQQTVTTVGSFGGGNWIMQGLAARQGDASQVGFVRASWWILGVAALASCAGPTRFFGLQPEMPMPANASAMAAVI